MRLPSSLKKRLPNYVPEEDDAMKKHITAKHRKLSAGSRIVASLKEAVDWVEGKDVRVRVAKMEVFEYWRQAATWKESVSSEATFNTSGNASRGKE